MIRTLRLSLLVTLLAVSAYYAILHVKVLRIDHPITQDEPGVIEITRSPNPYTLAGVATTGSVYGLGYSLWARPFTALLANPYIAHRVATTLALFIAMAVLAWSLRREGIGGVEIAAGLGIFYILNVSSHSLAATPDLLGVALYLGALAVSRRGTWPALLFGLVLLAGATLTKPYFLLGWVAVLSQLALFATPRKALGYLAASVAAALAVGVTLTIFAPYYFLSTVVVHQVAAVRSLSTLLHQTGEFALLAIGLVVLALSQLPRRRAVALGARTPLLSPAFDLWSWAAVLAAAALLAALGWHSGNYLVYYYHLLLGPLIIVALRQLARWPRFGRLALTANLMVLGYLLPPQPGNDRWGDLAADVAGVQGPILADPLLEPITHRHANVELISHGFTLAIVRALDQLPETARARYAVVYRRLMADIEKTNARVRAREFSAVYISYQEISGARVWSYDQQYLMKSLVPNYALVSEVIVYPYEAPYWQRLQHGAYPYHLTRWEPRAVTATPRP